MRRVEVLLLGPIEVRDSAGPVAIGGNRARSVLAALLLDANRVVAVTFHLQALVLIQDSGDRHAKADVLVNLADCRHHLGDSTRALAPADQAVAIASRSGYRVLEGKARATLANVYLSGGRPGLAAQEAHKAVDLQRATGYSLGLRRARRVFKQAQAHLAAIW